MSGNAGLPRDCPVASLPPLVTIITPTYNQAAYIAETIESVLAQDYPAIEYIVIDDGSTDATPDILAGYSTRLSSIRQENAGQSCTINRGISLAKGQYVGYLSSDDVLHPNAISKLVAALEDHPDVVCAFPDADLIDEKSQVVKRKVCRPFDLAELIVRQECYIGPGAIFRTAVAQSMEGWRPELKLAPDREFWIRLAAHGQFFFLRESLAGYRTHPASTSVAVRSEAVTREYFDVLDAYFASDAARPEVLERRDEAYGFAYFKLALNCARDWRWVRAFHHYRKARGHSATLRSPYYLYLIARVSLSGPLRGVYRRILASMGS